MSKTGQCGGWTDVAESLYVTQPGVRRIKVDEGHVLSAQELQDKLDSREPIEAPKSMYKTQPENQGKIVWLSGPPGEL